MLNKVAETLNGMAKGSLKLDKKLKEMELVRTVEGIQQLRNELKQLEMREAELMMELGVSIVIVDGKVEIA